MLERHHVAMTSAAFETALFEMEGSRVRATEMSRGPWDPRHCHGGPVSALLARGTTGLVASVVPVPDLDAVPLMQSLHEGLRRGVPVGRALHAARQAVDRQDPRTFVSWCAFAAVNRAKSQAWRRHTACSLSSSTQRFDDFANRGTVDHHEQLRQARRRCGTGSRSFCGVLDPATINRAEQRRCANATCSGHAAPGQVSHSVVGSRPTGPPARCIFQ